METVHLPISLRELNADLRNALSGILGNAQFLQDALEHPDLKELAINISKSGNNLLKLTELLTTDARGIAKTNPYVLLTQ
jgi:nitrogen-specific signal transduction histidine kinase